MAAYRLKITKRAASVPQMFYSYYKFYTLKITLRSSSEIDLIILNQSRNPFGSLSCITNDVRLMDPLINYFFNSIIKLYKFYTYQFMIFSLFLCLLLWLPHHSLLELSKIHPHVASFENYVELVQSMTESKENGPHSLLLRYNFYQNDAN